MDNLERQLTCPICLEMFNKPVLILPCQHNLCRKCANDVFQSRGTPSVVGSGGRFRCPTCRHEVVLDRHGVYGLQRNLLVENIIDIYKQEMEGTGIKITKKKEELMCEVHEEERINVYCVACQFPICSMCKVFGEHQDHEVATIPEVHSRQKIELSDCIAKQVAANDKLQSVISLLEEGCRVHEMNAREVKAAICDKFDRLYSIIEDRKGVLLSLVTEEQLEKQKVLQELIAKYSGELERAAKSVEESLLFLEEPDKAAFLTKTKELIERINAAIESSNNANIPEQGGFEHLQVDFSKEEDVLQKLDFVKEDTSVADAETQTRGSISERSGHDAESGDTFADSHEGEVYETTTVTESEGMGILSDDPPTEDARGEGAAGGPAADDDDVFITPRTQSPSSAPSTSSQSAPHYYLYNTEVNPLQDRPPMSRASMEYYASVLNNKPEELPTDEAATAQASNEVAPKVAEGAAAKVAEETAKVAEGTANVTEGTTSEVESKIEDTVEKDKEEESEVETAIGDFRRRRKFTTAKAIETAVGENTPRLITVTPEESQAIREFLSSVSSLTPPPSPAGRVSPAQDGTTEPGKPGETATQPQQTTAQTAQETMGILQDEEDDIVVLGPTERKFEKNGNESITGYLRKATTTGSDVTNMDAGTSAAVLQINHKPIRGILRRSSSEGSTGTSHGRRVRFSIEEDYKENERDSDMETELGDVEVDDAEAMGFSFLGHD
ncbi:PREDICTED: tripartite motif-containing protein 55-like isoform X1 [Branchiostoma belcheri]|uniref:Tripartite motif-containing protein 55-like isoform X1 n=1 Tax=Branchiostoma belcheri TaxID=7741 RepID=A0A6P5AIF6_BRABE|nr:PREDICTED: tripartite motif-containing protein 55-like isoform X1 [Branchiostoma belcheri]